ncbi:hypothetical protein DFJ73DRAFT_925719, partial [Zopfochytrium polystomum]
FFFFFFFFFFCFISAAVSSHTPPASSSAVRCKQMSAAPPPRVHSGCRSAPGRRGEHHPGAARLAQARRERNTQPRSPHHCPRRAAPEEGGPRLQAPPAPKQSSALRDRSTAARSLEALLRQEPATAPETFTEIRADREIEEIARARRATGSPLFSPPPTNSQPLEPRAAPLAGSRKRRSADSSFEDSGLGPCCMLRHQSRKHHGTTPQSPCCCGPTPPRPPHLCRAIPGLHDLRPGRFG